MRKNSGYRKLKRRYQEYRAGRIMSKPAAQVFEDAKKVCHDAHCFSRPFGILYRIDPHEIVIIAVMHLRRRPGYWADRV